jgi:pleckstrin homology domain-containing family G member 4
MIEIGDSVTAMDQLIQELREFEESCQIDLTKAAEVMTKGKSIIDSNSKTSSKDTVEPKCNELCRITEVFNEKLNKRAETLLKARDLMERVELANEWCAKGIELLASQRIENVSVPPETAEIKLQEIIKFVESAEDFQLSSLRDYDDVLLMKAIVSQVRYMIPILFNKQ